jgi:hypothetical protein
MDFLRRLFAPPAPSRSVLPIAVQCLRCGETLTTEINLNNEISADYGEEGGGPTFFVCRKLLTGTGRCFQQVEVILRFDGNRQVVDKQITGGKFV